MLLGAVEMKLFILALFASAVLVSSWAPTTGSRVARHSTFLQAKRKDKDDENDINPLTKASWFAVEAFGKVFGAGDSAAGVYSASSPKELDLTKPPSSINETIERIKLDNERSYFLSGSVDKFSYAEDCVFSDPFVSFEGRNRFVDNLANLGSFITNYSAKTLEYIVAKDQRQVQTKVMVKLELNLPWKPILAWPWGVTYDIDPNSFLITNHKESWDIEPWEGVKQIFRKPTTTIKKET